MDREKHYRGLERMYLVTPINRIFNPKIKVSRERAEIEIDVRESYFHGAGAVHGCVYFKMMDDAAFFAANSIVRDCFVLTLSFTTYLTRPVSAGVMRSVGKVVAKARNQIIAEAVVYDQRGKEVGKGSGVFVKGKIPLAELPGYLDS
ncbi:MAG: thioesterase [Deltaproteobacteria bacterium]|nr:MAG: thioesterase [Deltaproteobacteria bacterium]HDG98479.1 PaaI family thioesterase [Desulfobacterales bacterium]